MKIAYWPEHDMLVIQLSGAPQSHGHDAEDPDIVVHFDHQERLVEIEISNASNRVDIDRLRRLDVFEEAQGVPAHYSPIT